MQKNDIINYTKATMEKVMTSFLFEAINEDTRSSMEQTIVKRLINNIDVDFSVNVDIENDDIKSAVILYNEDGKDNMIITARYGNCPTISQSETNIEPKKAVIDYAAFERAMEII